MKQYPEAKHQFPAYFEFLWDCKSKLIEAATSIVSEDLNCLAPEIGADIVQKINQLFGKYKDYSIRKPANRDILEKYPKRIFDGTLARYDNWVKKVYRWGITNPQDIRLSEANKMWMKYQLGAENPVLRAKVQEYMDCLVFSGVLKMFYDNPSFRLSGYKKINF